ncbi:MAG: DNA alkylation repair protein [Verrucomicrobiia bacterium]
MPRKIIKFPRQVGHSSGESAVNNRQAHAALLALANPNKAEFLAGFFKTGKGQYAQGDRFLGIMVPAIRQLSRQFRQLDLTDCERLLQSAYNDERLLALMILVEQYRKGDVAVKNKVYQIYLNNRHRVNNWNLVDGSAPYIVGAHLLNQNRSLLYELAKSRSLWDRRIAVLATFSFIRADDFVDTLKLAEQLLGDEHDLIHKACGWMLREVGKRNQSVLECFLRQHHDAMPRTMLRYAIERFPPAKRTGYLTGKIR